MSSEINSNSPDLGADANASEPKLVLGTDSFFNSIPKYFETHQISANFRALKDGIFVDEGSIELLILAYQEWTKRNSSSGEGKSLEKCRKRLLGTGELPLQYALDGNRCLVGYLLKGEKSDLKESKIPFYPGNLRSAVDYIHHRDPYLLKLESIKSRMSNHDGLLFEYTIGTRRLEVSELGLKEFAAAVRKDPRRLRNNPMMLLGLRYVLEPLLHYLQQLRFIKSNAPLLVPGKFSNKPNLGFFRSGELVFTGVLDSSDGGRAEPRRIHSCFSTKGKGLIRFVRDEVSALSGASSGSNSQSFEVKGFAAGSAKKHCLGRCWSQGITFHLNSRTLIYFLRQAPKVPKVASKLPNHFSVKDLLERFASIFRNSKPADEAILRSKLRRRDSFAKYRLTGNWLFVITDKNVISSCVYLKEKTVNPTKAA